jgi:hypothetical protein
VRVGATTYRETLLSLLYPGNYTSVEALIPAVLAAEEFLGLTPEQRPHIIWRTDGGFGSDANLHWLINRHYHILAKGFSWKRAMAWARRVHDWVEVRPGQRWLAWAPEQLDLGRPTRIVIARWLTPSGKWRYALYITTLLDLPLLTTIADLYDDRGGAEVEIGSDKTGLKITHRCSQCMLAQEALILLADLGHNLLAWFHRDLLIQTRFATYGPKRIIQQLLCIPGELVFEGDVLVEVRLKQSHALAEPMLDILARLWDEDETLLSVVKFETE